MKKRKKTLLITSLTSCNGCLFKILDLGPELFAALENFDLLDFHLFEDEEIKKSESIDIVLAEGNVASRLNKEYLKTIRERAKMLIALGTCAHLGSIQRLKNYKDKTRIARRVYPNLKKINNLKIEPLSKYVEVDFVIPGCPPNKKEILEILKQLAINRQLSLPDRPVCYQCQIKNYPCLLLEGKPCLGPMIRGGCEAICIRGGLACTGCRGKTPEPNQEKMQKLLGLKEYKRILEIFGNV